jgi:hypothetical protein
MVAMTKTTSLLLWCPSLSLQSSSPAMFFFFPSSEKADLFSAEDFSFV